VDELAGRQTLQRGCPVFAAFSEFCVPTVGEAIDQALANGADKVIVVPTMLVRGNQLILKASAG
jgi:sirohydrochlorin ferrochelatase